MAGTALWVWVWGGGLSTSPLLPAGSGRGRAETVMELLPKRSKAWLPCFWQIQALPLSSLVPKVWCCACHVLFFLLLTLQGQRHQWLRVLLARMCQGRLWLALFCPIPTKTNKHKGGGNLPKTSFACFACLSQI